MSRVNRAENTDSEVFLGALQALQRYAEMNGLKDTFLSLLSYWTTPKDDRNQSKASAIRIISWRAFVENAKASTKESEATACLDTILTRRPLEDFAPTEYLTGHN